jgi:ferrous iron transport protein A
MHRSSEHSLEHSLDRLSPGTEGRILRVVGDDSLARRLGDLGFWPGTAVHVIRRAPWGDPSEYLLRGYRIALRRREAARIIIAPPEDPA